MGLAAAALGVTCAASPVSLACAFWKAVVPPVTRKELQASSPLCLGVAQGVAVQVTVEEVLLAVSGAALAWAAVPKPASTRAAVPRAEVPIRRHLPEAADALGEVVVRNGQLLKVGDRGGAGGG